MTPNDCTIQLAATLDLTAAPGLKTELQAAMTQATDIVCDAGGVTKVTTPALQVLAATVLATQRQGGKPLHFRNPSAVFAEAVATLGLGELLHLETANV